MDKSHLCGACRRVMCRECKQIATEYDDQLKNAKARLWKMEQELIAMRDELKREQRRNADLDHILKLGVGPQVTAWMDSLSSSALRLACERAATEAQHAE